MVDISFCDLLRLTQTVNLSEEGHLEPRISGLSTLLSASILLGYRFSDVLLVSLSLCVRLCADRQILVRCPDKRRAALTNWLPKKQNLSRGDTIFARCTLKAAGMRKAAASFPNQLRERRDIFGF